MSEIIEGAVAFMLYKCTFENLSNNRFLTRTLQFRQLFIEFSIEDELKVENLVS